MAIAQPETHGSAAVREVLDAVNVDSRYRMIFVFGSVSGPHIASSLEPSKRVTTRIVKLESLLAACSKRPGSACQSIFTNSCNCVSGIYTGIPFSSREFVADCKSSQLRGHRLAWVCKYSTIKFPVVHAAYDSGIL